MVSVIFVDDQQMILNSIRRTFRKFFSNIDIEFHYTTSPNEVIKMVREERDIAMLISDYDMGNICGKDLLDRARDTNPSLQGIILSANLSLGESYGGYKVLSKPFDCTKLCDAVQKGVAAYHESVRCSTAQKAYK